MERNARPPPLQRCSPGTKPISQNRPICFILTVVLGGTFEFSQQHLLEKVFCVSFWNTFLESSPNSIDHFGQVETDLLDIFWGHFLDFSPNSICHSGQVETGFWIPFWNNLFRFIGQESDFHNTKIHKKTSKFFETMF